MLVTHFMEEAQHLCDRVAVFDRGKIVALDSPDGLISSSDSSVVISFQPSKPLADATVQSLPGMASVTNEGAKVVIKGTDETVQAVVSLLAREDVTAHKLRVVDATLDDAFLSITAKAEGLTDYSDAVQGGS
jgi:ABC-2 type transport system ATP-binding protein